MIKKEVGSLALLGGVPAFAERLHVGRPNIGSRQVLRRRFDEMLDRCWLSNNGPFVQEFEEKLASLLQVKHCIVMSNATIALEIIARALGLQREVIVPSFTFIATAHALQWQGITPIFCDIDPASHNLDPEKVEDLITPRTSGIMGVHVWGRPCAVEPLTEIAQQHGLKLIFDAAHAFGCSHKQKMIGGFGDGEVFSFHATKFFNTFEGGAVTTNNDALAATVRRMRNFGYAESDVVVGLGTNAKMSEIAAVMGLTGLEAIDYFIEVNRRNYYAYRRYLTNVPGLRLINYNEAEYNNFQYIVVEVDEAVAGISRDQLVQILHRENILARRYFYPGCHQMEPYRSQNPQAGLLLSETESLAQRVMTLPTGTAVTVADIRKIAALIKFILQHSCEIEQLEVQVWG
jgi:dTDP-4-amino-4,6-dideoxygalactose transaminase